MTSRTYRNSIEWQWPMVAWGLKNILPGKPFYVHIMTSRSKPVNLPKFMIVSSALNALKCIIHACHDEPCTMGGGLASTLSHLGKTEAEVMSTIGNRNAEKNIWICSTPWRNWRINPNLIAERRTADTLKLLHLSRKAYKFARKVREPEIQAPQSDYCGAAPSRLNNTDGKLVNSTLNQPRPKREIKKEEID